MGHLSCPLHHREPTQSVCVADCYFIVNVLDLPFASPIATATSNSFKIAQKTAFEAKGRLYTTGKVIQRLFIIDLYFLKERKNVIKSTYLTALLHTTQLWRT